MVTFRFYVVSIVAFFLALAVGVVVGSVLDGRIADGLQDRLDRVEASLDETVNAMDAKNVEIERLERYVEASAPFAVEAQLNETSTLVVAESGIDAESVEDLVLRLRESGSRVEGIVWLEPRWDLRDSDDLAAARAIAGHDSTDAPGVRAAIWSRLASADGAPGGGDPSTTTAPTTVSDPGQGIPTDTAPSSTTTIVRTPPTFDASPLSELADAGLIRLQVIDQDIELPGGPLLVVGATGLESSMRTPGGAVGELVSSLSAAGVPSVLAEVTAEPAPGEREQRGSLAAAALDDALASFSTVDDLELIAGRVASVLALADARDGVFGRYGYGPDAESVLPAWRGP